MRGVPIAGERAGCTGTSIRCSDRPRTRVDAYHFAMPSTDRIVIAPRWASIAAIWGGVGLFDATQTVVSMKAMGMHHAWVALFVSQCLAWLPWALATPAVIRLSMRAPLRLRWVRTREAAAQALRAWGQHGASWLALTLGASLWIAVTEHLLNPWNPDAPPRPVPELFLAQASTWLLPTLFIYYCIVMAGRVLETSERLALQRAASADLARELAQAQLDALRHQVEPHFLFNALNAIAGLVREHRNELAVETIARIGEFLRHTLHGAATQEVPLEEELRFAQMYLDIQKLRFGERMSLRLDVAPAPGRALVPRLILQPLVENAIKHGIAHRAQAGSVELHAQRTSAGLVISVYNDGPAIAAGVLRETAANDAAESSSGLHGAGDARRSGSIGLTNVRNRLRGLYGVEATLEVANVEGRGVRVTIRLPWREATEAGSGAHAA
jgi:signal transduction histidine kinase